MALRGGLNTILKNVIDCQLSRINEALITTILHLLNHPKTRQYVRVDVELEVGTLIFFFSFKYDFKYDFYFEILKSVDAAQRYQT